MAAIYRIVRCANGAYTAGSTHFSIAELRQRESSLDYSDCLRQIEEYHGPMVELPATPDAQFEDYREYVPAANAAEPCSRCGGLGEIPVASYDLGDGCFNDDFGTCPRCKGSGKAA